MALKTLLAATALLTTVSATGHAQVAPEMGGRQSTDRMEDVQTPESLPASRQMGTPEGTQQAKPADPTVQPQGARQPATGQPGDTAATNVSPPPGSGAVTPGAGSNAQAKSDTEKPAALNTTEAQSPNNTRGGGALATNQVYTEDLAEMSVSLSDKEDFGNVAGTVLNLETGQVESLLISTGGLLGAIGDTIYEVPWSKVAGVDKRAKEVKVNATEAEVHPRSEDQARQGN
ncbi:PRC-barrel domain-containing protein [Skermanella stibiiresistens]|nr:PRC-barrel domain-containing protein [Skermanella stibiiresistens]